MVLGGKTQKIALFSKKSRISQNSDFLQKYQYFVNIHDFSEISRFLHFGSGNHQYSIGFISFWRHVHFPCQKSVFMCEIHNFTFFITRGVGFSWNSEFSMFGTVCTLDFLPVAAGTTVVTPPLRRPVVIFEIL